ncbi:hypothetical protein JYT32_00080 [Dehalococcoides mccartyi]|nr:hypothetical protein [Dehalococcoides mccartyi]
MEEPLRTVVAGMIGGALMGLVFVTHMALLLVFSPPEVLKNRAEESNVSNLITLSALVMFMGWTLLAILMSFAAKVTQSGDPPVISIAPSPAYLFIVTFITLFIAIPAFIFFRDRQKHMAGELFVFVGIFGLLIPNLVVAIHQA